MRVRSKVTYCAALVLLFATPASGQQKNPQANQGTQQDSAWAQIKQLEWKLGPTQATIAGVATITVPTDSAFLSSAGTRRFLELQGNLAADNNYTFAPNDLS